MSPGKYPGSSGSRNLHDNLSDLRAQVAANQKVANKSCDVSYGYCDIVGYHISKRTH